MITPQLVQELLLVGTGGVLPQAYHPLKLHLNLVGTGGGDWWWWDIPSTGSTHDGFTGGSSTTTSWEWIGTTTTGCSKICPMNWNPVCGSDMVTYGNDCQFDNAKCAENTSLEIVQRGPCDNTSTHDIHVDPIETTPGYISGSTNDYTATSSRTTTISNWWSTSTSLPSTGSTHDDFTGSSSGTSSWEWWIMPISSYGSTEYTSTSTLDQGSTHDDFTSTGTTEGYSTSTSFVH